MATLTGSRAASTFPVASPSTRGVLQVAWGTYTLGANPTANDTIRFCKLPAGATVIDGWLIGADIDTGTEALDIDIGWEANGTDAADTDGFGNFGVLTGAAITGLKPVAGIRMPFANVIQDSGFKTFAAETFVTGLVNAAANAGGTGVLKVIVHFVVT